MPLAETTADTMSERDIYFIETYLRQRGDHNTLLTIDALVIRQDLSDDDKTMQLQQIIQGAINVK